MRLNVDLATAAMILALVLNGAAMPQAAMAEGGKVQAGEPVLVGERGPEVFVPGVPGSVLPKWKHGWGKDDLEETPGKTLAHVVKPSAWDRWLADLPESTNVEDWRTPVQRAEDNQLWRVSWDPTFENPYESYYAPGGAGYQPGVATPSGKTYVQFPPAPPENELTPSDEIYADWVKSKSQPAMKASTAPDWLRDQESQWLLKQKRK